MFILIVDLTRKCARGLPMIVLFDPAGRVRQSFAGALKKDDFLDVLKRVASDVRTNVADAPPRRPGTEAIVIPSGWLRLSSSDERNPAPFAKWMAAWRDLIDFEVVSVITSAEAAERVAPRL